MLSQSLYHCLAVVGCGVHWSCALLILRSNTKHIMVVKWQCPLMTFSKTAVGITMAIADDTYYG